MEKALAERDKLRVQVDAQKAVIIAKDEQILALQGVLKVQEQIASDWKAAALNRKSAITADEALFKRYDDEVARLRLERDSARRNNLLYGAVGTVFGIAVGVVASRK
jgi:hypothetical protein